MGKKLPKVLIVDDELEVVEMLREFLAFDRAIYEIVTAGNSSEALAILDREEIALVLSDVVMPEINGIELLDKIKRRFPEVGVILMSSYGTAEMRDKIQPLDCLRFIEKPFAISELRQLLRENLDKQQQGFAGTLNNMQLTDIIQMCCLATMSMVIQVQQNSHKGIIVISDGEIVHAVCEDEVGEAAFYEIISWERGNFQTLRQPAEIIMSVNKGWQFLLMEAARLKDEKALKKDAIVGMPKTPQATLTVSAQKPDTASRPDWKPESGKCRVLIVDDSAMMCKVITRLLSPSNQIEIIGTAQNGEEALEKIIALKPDIITLDVNMPIMGGSTALKHIMLKNPCPVVIISSIGHKGRQNILDFLRLGAVDFLSKPAMNADMAAQEELLAQRICLAASAHVENFQLVKAPPLLSGENAGNIKIADKHPPEWNGMPYTSPALVIVNSGIGGYAELIRLVPLLNNKMRGAVVALQTMPPEFIRPFCEYLNERSQATVLPLLPSNMNQNDEVTGRPPPAPLIMKMGSCYIGTNQFALDLDVIDGEYGLFTKLQDTVDKGNDQHDNNFDRFLISVADSFPGVIIVVLLSGAEVGSLAGLQRIKALDGWIISQKLDTCMITAPLKKALNKQLITLEASASEIVNMILTA